jgi:hypothetical protein
MGRRYSLVFFRVNFSFCLRVVAMSFLLTLPPFFYTARIVVFTVQTSVYVFSLFLLAKFRPKLKFKQIENEVILKVY